MTTCDDCGALTDKPTWLPKVSNDWRVCPGCASKRSHDPVERALAFVAEFKGDARCGLNCLHAEALAGEVLRLRKAQDGASVRAVTCEWEEDADGLWGISCDGQRRFTFNTGGVFDNGFEWCPYCGKKLVEVRPEQEDDDAFA